MHVSIMHSADLVPMEKLKAFDAAIAHKLDGWAQQVGVQNYHQNGVAESPVQNTAELKLLKDCIGQRDRQIQELVGHLQTLTRSSNSQEGKSPIYAGTNTPI